MSPVKILFKTSYEFLSVSCYYYEMPPKLFSVRNRVSSEAKCHL